MSRLIFMLSSAKYFSSESFLLLEVVFFASQVFKWSNLSLKVLITSVFFGLVRAQQQAAMMAMNSNVPTTSSVMSSTRLSSNVAAANNMFHHRHHDSSAAQALSQQQYMSANSHNLVVSILLCNTESKATTKDICQTNFHFIPLLNIKTRQDAILQVIVYS